MIQTLQRIEAIRECMGVLNGTGSKAQYKLAEAFCFLPENSGRAIFFPASASPIYTGLDNMRNDGAEQRNSGTGAKEIYLCEAGEHVGPFRSREDAEKFIVLMELFGSSSEGVEIVELELDSDEIAARRRKRSGAANHPIADHQSCCGK